MVHKLHPQRDRANCPISEDTVTTKYHPNGFMDYPIMSNSVLHSSSSGNCTVHPIVDDTPYSRKFVWVQIFMNLSKSVLPKFSQFLISQQGSRPITTPL